MVGGSRFDQTHIRADRGTYNDDGHFGDIANEDWSPFAVATDDNIFDVGFVGQ